MSNKHTPGPWLIETFTRPNRGEVTQVSAFSEDGNRILCCDVQSFKKIEDSRLIAAAPELLEALHLAVKMAETGMCDFNPHDEYVMNKARAAIAKAAGGAA